MTRKAGFTIADRGQELHRRALNLKGKPLFSKCSPSSPKGLVNLVAGWLINPASYSLPASGSKMYSNSNSYLGGGNSARPGQPQYGQSSYSNFQQGQQQPGGLAPQPTGFGNAPLQQQYTGYPQQAQQQQQQYTGFPQQTQPPQQQPIQTGQATPTQLPQRTGQTSSQIAQSFQASLAAPTPAPRPTAASTKIPKIRLSFLTAQDQAKFEQLFKSAVGDGQALDGTIEWRPWTTLGLISYR